MIRRLDLLLAALRPSLRSLVRCGLVLGLLTSAGCRPSDPAMETSANTPPPSPAEAGGPPAATLQVSVAEVERLLRRLSRAASRRQLPAGGLGSRGGARL